MEINNGLIKENSELRELSRQQLKGKWGTAILLCFIFSIITGLLGFIPIVGVIISWIIAGPLTFGLISCFLKLVRNENFRFENLFDGFKHFASSFLLMLLMGIFVFLWSLLLIIPGIIAAYRYSMSFYILNDNPEIGAMDALRESKKMMIGYKGKLFLLNLSFIGWAILSVLTAGIGFLWLIPYMNTATANFYQNLKDASKTEISSSTI
ncbi:MULTISPECIES: DUF975 family protein [Clostridium]|jgi:uncharacterized membrane protein|uniref:DUF975 family protein n=1 Tax=Clostridium TaxID=1485 RepID=UPI00028A00C8|nr:MULTISPECIES: DUF975 family protein [Clostridium]MDF2505900.1 hypothetical protein [Clostridium sp.]